MNRLKKILKWTGITLAALVALGLVANAIFVWTTDARLERQRAAIRAAGEPVTLADLARPPIPPEKNAATYLRQAKEDVGLIEKDLEETSSGGTYPRFPMSPEDAAAIRAAMKAHPRTIHLLQKAASCPDYAPPREYTRALQDYQTQWSNFAHDNRDTARVLYAQALLLVNDGNRDEGLHTALTIFRLAHHFDHNFGLGGYLVAILVRNIAIDAANLALQSGPVSKEVRGELDAELAIHERMDGFAWAMTSDRAASPEYYAALVPGRNFWLVARGVWNMQESACLEVWPTYIALARNLRSYREVEKAIDNSQPYVAGLPLPAIEIVPLKNAYAMVLRTRAEICALRVLNALQTHVSADSNETPKLTELGLPAATITDPFTGEPLHVKNTPQGWLVYSVGPNFKDDGGKLHDPTNGDDVGVGPPPPPETPAGK